MAKIVKYNGGTESYYDCSEPTELVVGEEYEVVFTRDRGWQTDYALKGIDGEFNSIWFEEISSDPNFYIAISTEIPVVDKIYACHKLEFINGRPKLVSVSTSLVKGVEYKGNNIYEVKTLNSVYLVNVG